MSFLEELKRRNVVRMGVLYVVAAWLILQVTEVLTSVLPVPAWTGSVVFILLVAGFLPVLIFSWVYELTPEGLKREKDLDRGRSITRETGHKINVLIIVLLVLAIGVVVVDRMIPESEPVSEAVFLEPTGMPDEAEPDETTAAGFAAAPANSIAVLPFVNMSGDAENEYFADGLSEEILNFLAGVPDLRVTARTSSFQFKGQNKDVREVGEGLNVANVLEGSVRRSGDRARITAQLIRTADGYHLWSETYDRTLEDVFEVQTDIAESVTRALGVIMDDAQRQKMQDDGVRDVEAFIAFQKGRSKYWEAHSVEIDMDILVEAAEWFTEAIRREPRFAAAYFLRSDLYAHRTSTEDISDEDRRAAYESYVADLAAASEYARTPAEKAVIDVDRTLVSSNWRPLRERIEAALSAEKCVETVWLEAVLPFGYAEQSLNFWRRSVECNPLSFYSYYIVSRSAIWAGQPELALQTAMRGLELNPEDPNIQYIAVLALLALDRIDEARARAESSDAWNRNVQIGIVAAASGDATAAREATARALAEAKGWTRKYLEVQMNAIVGNREAANEAAAWFDSIPTGQLMLAAEVMDCNCGAPFDLEATPVFARRLAESGLPWPPAASIKFPAMQE